MARIALDAMGGDHAPQATIAGALSALSELGQAHSIQLVGRSEVIRKHLDAGLAGEFDSMVNARERLEIIEAPDVITMTDKPAVVIRGKPKSSMMVGLTLQTTGKSDAFVSAGSTGAQMAASTVLFKLHPGLTRPAIGTILPTARKPVVMLDAGANVDCSPDELVQFARLGTVYAEDILVRSNPAVGLLSIGEEPEKGNAAVKEAHQLLKKADLNFVGNMEGRDVLQGENRRGPVDVVVCDGFVGNVLLKFYESVAPLMLAILKKKAGIDWRKIEPGLRQFDPSEVGGAPLLGVRGVSVICHGASSPRAIKNAIVVALRAVESQMTDHIGKRLMQGSGAGT
ncbi:MAG: phosphate acyltransferase PlsX [Gemmatimonadota bacterium]|nr:phosphate acyltransferase PlsX [Gemmatimonadota bacterium]